MRQPQMVDAKGRLTSEIAEAIGLTPRSTHTQLARLVGRGIVREIGTGRRTRSGATSGRIESHA